MWTSLKFFWIFYFLGVFSSIVTVLLQDYLYFFLVNNSTVLRPLKGSIKLHDSLKLPAGAEGQIYKDYQYAKQNFCQKYKVFLLRLSTIYICNFFD